jgi:hypothetical protein
MVAVGTVAGLLALTGCSSDNQDSCEQAAERWEAVAAQSGTILNSLRDGSLGDRIRLDDEFDRLDRAVESAQEVSSDCPSVSDKAG